MSEAVNTPKMTMTDHGKLLIARSVAQEQLNFTRMAMGDGQIANSGSMPSMTALIHERVSVSIDKSVRDGNVITVSGPVHVPANTEAFRWREVGLFGKIGAEPEKLIAIAYKGEAGEMVAPDDGEERSIHVSVEVDAAANVTVTLVPRETVDWDQINDPPVICRPARIVVGGAGAGWTESDCDYLCAAGYGGANNAIRSAIAALPDTGGEIVLLSGSYWLTVNISIEKSNVTIRGNGPATSVFFGMQNAHFKISGNYCTLRDFALSSASTSDGIIESGISISGQYATVKHIVFDVGGYLGGTLKKYGVVSAETARYTRVLDCDFINVQCGIVMQGMFETVRGNTFMRRSNGAPQLQVGSISGHHSVFIENIIVSDRMTGPTIAADQGNIAANNITASSVIS